MAVFSATHSISAEQTATSNVSRKGFPQTPASKRTHRRRLRRARSSKRVYRHLVWQREEPVRAQGVASKLANLELEIAALKFQLRVRETKAAAAPRPPQKIKVEQKEEISTPPVTISCLMDENMPVDLAEAFPTVFVLRAMGLPIVSLCKCGHHAPPVVAEKTAETNQTADTHKTSAKGKLPGLPPSAPSSGGSSAGPSGDIMIIAQKYFSVSVRVVHRSAQEIARLKRLAAIFKSDPMLPASMRRIIVMDKLAERGIEVEESSRFHPKHNDRYHVLALTQLGRYSEIEGSVEL